MPSNSSLATANSDDNAPLAWSSRILDIFAVIDERRDEIEKTVAAVSLIYVQDAKHIASEMRGVGLVQRKSECHVVIFLAECPVC